MKQQLTAAHDLTVRDYQRVFAVLEHVESARTVTDFRELTLEAFGSALGYRNTTFFRGPTFATLFQDPDPLLAGRMPSMIREYRAEWSQHDVFSLPESLSLFSRTNAASAEELHVLPDHSRQYLDQWFGRYGMSSVNAVYLRPGGQHALIGVFGPDRMVGPAQLEVLRLLGKHLSAISQHLPAGDDTSRGDDLLSTLSPRDRDVAELICNGLSNAMIGHVLSLTEGTVKKYVSRILAQTGCRSRTELVLCLRQH
ncbi:MAG: LuxR C-terminal-related transcriptional regulator [Aeromicrobium sp.]